MIFNSIINSIHNTPNLNNPSTLVDFLWELRGASDAFIRNPLGIQGITFHVDTAITMIENFLYENRTVQITETLNYNSNLMYILVNKLSPSIL
jgi:hypothetical protein